MAQIPQERKYLGSGPVYPVDIENGTVRIVSGTELVKSDLVKLLSTPKGTVDFLPEYGSRVQELLFEMNDNIFEGMARELIVEAINEWEHRIEFDNAEFTFYSELPEQERRGEDAARVDIFIQYRIKATEEIDAMIWPFYRQAT